MNDEIRMTNDESKLNAKMIECRWSMSRLPFGHWSFEFRHF